MKYTQGWRLPGAAAALPLLLALGQASAQITLAAAPSPGLGPAPSPAATGGPVNGVQQVPIARPDWQLQPKPLPVQPTSPPHSLLGAPPPRGTVTMKSLRLASNAPGKDAKIYIGPHSEFAIGTDAAGNFMIEKAGQGMPVVEMDTSNVVYFNAARVQADSINVASHYSLRGVRQWELVASEDFSNSGAGWTRLDVTQCAGVFMLGGYCKFSQGEVNKTFSGLLPHTHLRIKATYHFIDRWIGESGYLKLNVGEDRRPVTVWSEMHAQEQSKNGISICGQGDTPEGKFAVAIDVTVPHTAADVQLTFGSTMADSDPCDESWGVSGVELYTRM